MFHSILTHLWAHVSVHWKLEVGVPAAFVALGLFLHDATQPKVVAVVEYLADWSMLWTWEWWTRMIIFMVIGAIALHLQKQKYVKLLAAQQTEWASKIASLQAELRHSEIMLSGARTRVAILEKRPGKK